MKFADVPQFTRYGNWECDYDLRRFVKAINEFKQEYALEMNPDFQRGHVWTENQQKNYVEFILKGGRSARVIYLNNPNWTRKNVPDDREFFVCVDGLQRFTAVEKFINNELRVFDHYYKEFEDSVRLSNTMKIHVNDLETKKEVLQWYLDFNSGGTIHSEEEIQRVKELLAQES